MLKINSKAEILLIMLLCIYTKTISAEANLEFNTTKKTHHGIQLEIILFKNNSYTLDQTKELLQENEIKLFSKQNSTSSIKEYNYIKPKFLTKHYEKINANINYKVVLYSGIEFTLPVNNKFKKIVLFPGNTNNLAIDNQNLDPFKVQIQIMQFKNIFNLKLDAKLGEFNLVKSVKLKSKEIFYFDHPKFGALITLINLNK